MAEDKKQKQEQKPKQESKEQKEKEKKGRPEPVLTEALIRVYGYDLPGSRQLYAALTRIKGVSWAVSNAICLKLGFSRNMKIQDLTKADIAKIEEFLHHVKLPAFMMNRRSDPETGETSHKIGTDLDVTREFDIKRLKKMKSYKGIRHSAHLPVRGQRTRSHFRTKKIVKAGVAGKKKAPKTEGTK